MSDRKSKVSRGSRQQQRRGASSPRARFHEDSCPPNRQSAALENESHISQALSSSNQETSGTTFPSHEILSPPVAGSRSDVAIFQNTSQLSSEPRQNAPYNQKCSSQAQYVGQQYALTPGLLSRSLASAEAHHAIHSTQSHSPHPHQQLLLSQRTSQPSDTLHCPESDEVDLYDKTDQSIVATESLHTQAQDSEASVSSAADSVTGNQTTHHDASTRQNVVRTPESTSSIIQQVMKGYSSKDIHLFRLRTMTTSIGRMVMHRVFQEATKERPQEMTLFEFYEKNNVNVKVFKKNLNEQQRLKIQKDLDGQSYDITLLFMCIQYGGSGVADGKDAIWREGTDCLESLLTTLKNKRNELFHDDLSVDENQFFTRTENLRKLLTIILQYAGMRYNMQLHDVEETIRIVNEEINILRDNSLISPNLKQYKKQNLFSEKREFVQIEGRLWLNELYGDWVYITPASLLCDVDFKVSDIYTEMVLRGESNDGKKVPVKFEDLLNQIDQCNKDPIVLVEGLAGVGKTTLTKKIMDDWVSGQSTMTNLTSYDLLLYAECRDRVIQSFKDLVTSLMSKVAKSFQDSDFVNVILDHKVIVIIDGLDEFNSSSISLFNEILELKKTHGITVLATTRPERVRTYYEMTKARRIKTKHIELTGIPKEKREDFVIKYHEELKKKGKTKENVTYLLKYLKRTALRLSHLWMLPYNLTLLTVLWVYRSMIVNQIATEAELYWEIYQLLLDKLFERLRGNDLTRALSETLVRGRVKTFMYMLNYEALNGLAQDEINLSDEAIGHLEDACSQENLPVEEMTGAFLKRIIMRTKHEFSTKCSFPHKGLQEFWGALYIHMLTKHEIEGSVVEEILQEFKNTLSSHNVADEISLNVLRLNREMLTRHALPSTARGPFAKQTNRVRNILEKFHSTSEFDISKYQNLLTTLLGLFHLKDMDINDTIKLEILELLRETGITSREDWLRILASVKYDDFVAKFVSRQNDIFKGYIKISDATVLAYLSLLQALKDPVRYAHRVNVSINIEEMSPINELVEEINRKRFTVKRLMFHHDFRKPDAKVLAEGVLNEVFQRCQVTEYWGSFTENMHLPPTINSLRISLANEDAYNHLNKFLASYKGSLALCLPPSMNSSTLLPLNASEYLPDLYISDVESAELMDAVDVAKKLQPRSGKHMKFGRILFPRCSLHVRDLGNLIEEMHKAMVKVCFDVPFPTSLKPVSTEDDMRLQEEAKTKLGCKYGIRWGGGNIDDW